MVRIVKDVATDRGLLQAPPSKYVKEMRKARKNTVGVLQSILHNVH